MRMASIPTLPELTILAALMLPGATPCPTDPDPNPDPYLRLTDPAPDPTPDPAIFTRFLLKGTWQ